MTTFAAPRFAIFDLDGLLIDSEPLWRLAEVEILGGLGVPLTEPMCFETMGLRIDEVVRYWHDRHSWPAADLEAVEAAIVERVRQLILARGAPLPGALEAVAALDRAGSILALASSSPPVLIDAALAAL
ncbi:MAG: HAD family hydrolase, partial [Acidobacteriota bacterium]